MGWIISVQPSRYFLTLSFGFRFIISLVNKRKCNTHYFRMERDMSSRDKSLKRKFQSRLIQAYRNSNKTYINIQTKQIYINTINKTRTHTRIGANMFPKMIDRKLIHKENPNKLCNSASQQRASMLCCIVCIFVCINTFFFTFFRAREVFPLMRS